ncbi:threonine/serine exporter family protein [Cytobacillus gottheilii]|uniref:Threonine/serine exporter n=2 Tax=Bacillaceae TaxID=186817 RepID=A0A7V7UVU0_9BACI|nr:MULTISPECIES: threonine/serine exporter family protein [Bacillaceae]KAB2333460.1 threonine/serine exporter [Bacillus mesophilum]QVY59961.1 threonine/serine exporter family protein [Cytobacillus gottheilii]
MLTHLVTSFIASAAFGILFNAPKKSLLQCGFVGMVGWMIYIILVDRYFDAVVSSLIAAFSIAVLSQMFARYYRTPIIIFSVSGIIPLVPGGLAYDAMRNFVENDYNTAIQLAAKAFMISGSIAVGLVVSEVLNQLIRKIPLRKVKS